MLLWSNIFYFISKYNPIFESSVKKMHIEVMSHLEGTATHSNTQIVKTHWMFNLYAALPTAVYAFSSFDYVVYKS